MDLVVVVMGILVILMNMTVEIIEEIYHHISLYVLFLSFGYNFNIISLHSFLMLFYFLM